MIKKLTKIFQSSKPKAGPATILEINKTSGSETKYTNSRLFTSKIYQFKDLPEPINATEGNKIIIYF